MKCQDPRLLAMAASIAAQLNMLSAQGHSSGEMDSRRIDADETNMLALALEDMRTQVFEAEYPELKARSLLSVDSDVDPGADVFSYEEEDWSGNVKIIADNGYADDPPSVETKARKITHTIVSIGNGYNYTIQDMRRAAFSGRPLEARKAKAQRQKFEMGQDRIAALGSKAIDPNDTTSIPYGILNRPTGTGAGQVRSTAVTNTAWDSTPDAAGMIANLNAAVSEFVTDSAELYEPNTLILPVLSYLRLHHTYTTDGNPESAAQRFLASNGFVRRIVPWNLLKAVDGAGADQSRGLLMSSQPDIASLVIPQEFEVFAPERQNYAFKVLAHGRTAGACVYKPLGLRYLTGMPSA